MVYYPLSTFYEMSIVLRKKNFTKVLDGFGEIL